MKRESGYYWVKYKFEIGPTEWIVAEWYASKSHPDTKFWLIIDDEETHKDSDFEEIDERRIVRDEPKECTVEPPTKEELETKRRFNELFGKHGLWMD